MLKFLNYIIFQAGEAPFLETDELLEEEETKLSLYNIEIEKQNLLKKSSWRNRSNGKSWKKRLLAAQDAAELKEKQESIRKRVSFEDKEEDNFQAQTNQVLAGLTPTTPGEETVMEVLQHYQST